jgi:phosphate transport system protein
MGDVPSSELRRSYHDRLAELHDRTVNMVRSAAGAAEEVTTAFLDGDRAAGQRVADNAIKAAAEVGPVETDVLDLLALQAPVARDLRMILSAQAIAHAAELCLGLCKRLAARVGGAQDLLTEALRELIAQMGSESVDLLKRAAAAWAALDEEQVEAVISHAESSRQVQRSFMATLLELHLVPVDSAVDLGTTSRLYERLTDHAVEIAYRVLFAITGVAFRDEAESAATEGL